MDFADHALVTQENDLKISLAMRQYDSNPRLGPKYCVRCNEFNDRSEEGYCVCSDCMAAISVK